MLVVRLSILFSVHIQRMSHDGVRADATPRLRNPRLQLTGRRLMCPRHLRNSKQYANSCLMVLLPKKLKYLGLLLCSREEGIGVSSTWDLSGTESNILPEYWDRFGKYVAPKATSELLDSN